MDTEETALYENKYKYFLKYTCIFNPNKLCNKLSYNKCGLCNECYSLTDLEKNKIKHTDDELLEKFINHKDLITKEIQNLLNECGKTNGKINKVKVVMKIYNVLFHNFLYLIRHTKFLITNILKLEEFFNLDKEFFITYCKENNDDTMILNFMLEIHTFVKENNFILDKDMDKKLYVNFLERFMSHMEIYYDNIIQKNKNDNFIDIIDINNITNSILQLDI